MSFLPVSKSVYERPEPIVVNLRPSLARLAEKQLALDPTEFVVAHTEQIDGHVVAMIVYLSVQNYEGKKVMVFANTTAKQLSCCRLLDPHFVTDAPIGALIPVARFEPTQRGWKLARICAQAL